MLLVENRTLRQVNHRQIGHNRDFKLKYGPNLRLVVLIAVGAHITKACIGSNKNLTLLSLSRVKQTALL